MNGTLQELKKGESAVVLKVDESLSCRRRLEELGFLPERPSAARSQVPSAGPMPIM